MNTNITTEQKELLLTELHQKVDKAYLESAVKEGQAAKADNVAALLSRVDSRNNNHLTNLRNNKKDFDNSLAALIIVNELTAGTVIEVKAGEEGSAGALTQADIIQEAAKKLVENAYLQAMQAADAAQAVSVLNDAIVLAAAGNPLLSPQIIADAKNALADAQKAAADAIAVLSTVVPVAYNAIHAYENMRSLGAQVLELLSSMGGFTSQVVKQPGECIRDYLTGMEARMTQAADASAQDLASATHADTAASKEAIQAGATYTTAKNALAAAKAAIGLS